MSHGTAFSTVTHIPEQHPLSCPSGLASPLPQAAGVAPGQFQVFIKGKVVMVMGCVSAAQLESMTPNNDTKYWDLCVVLSNLSHQECHM